MANPPNSLLGRLLSLEMDCLSVYSVETCKEAKLMAVFWNGPLIIKREGDLRVKENDEEKEKDST